MPCSWPTLSNFTFTAATLVFALAACTFNGTGLGDDASASASTGTETGSTTDATSTSAGTTATTMVESTSAGTMTAGTTAGTTTMGTTTMGTTTMGTTSMGTTSMGTTMGTTVGPSCGDGMVDPGEECDDGAANSDDASCKSNCTNNVCGDGAKGPAEGCDDGNLDDGDGCSAACVLETCGDGIPDPGEECDDNNQVNDDECTNACTKPVCGDMIVQKSNSEACDDGPGNGPTAACTPDCLKNICGDSYVLEGVEDCDDANDVNTDACIDCVLAACGDGFIQQGVEECDDGNTNDGDACSNACTVNGSRVFVTEQSFAGNLGGIVGADKKCQDAADAVSLGGTWKAWIATGKANEAPADTFVKSAAPYVRLDGKTVANSWADLTDGTLVTAINLTEKNAAPPNPTEVWTNAKVDGTAYDQSIHCNNFTSSSASDDARFGLRPNTDQKWTDNGTNKCNGLRHLYCFEQ